MYRVAHVQMFDWMDKLHIAIQIRTYEAGLGAEMHDAVEEVATDVQGVGADDAHAWARDALVALIEAL